MGKFVPGQKQTQDLRQLAAESLFKLKPTQGSFVRIIPTERTENTKGISDIIGKVGRIVVETDRTFGITLLGETARRPAVFYKNEVEQVSEDGFAKLLADDGTLLRS